MKTILGIVKWIDLCYNNCRTNSVTDYERGLDHEN